MTPWQFNLRSGFDSDEDDDSETPVQASEHADSDSRNHDTNDNSSSHHSLPDATNEDSTSKELRELFGTAEEEKVCYRPNPWSIAKMNANARAITERSSVHKPTFKPSWPTKPTKPVKQCVRGEIIVPGFTRPGPFAAKPLKDSNTSLQYPKAPSRPLRDSISEALRRGSDTALDVDNRTAENRNATIIPNSSIPCDSNVSETDVSLLSLGSNRFDDDSPQTPTTYQDDGAYIPEPETITSQNSPTIFPQAHSAPTYPPDSDPCESQTPALTWDHPNSDGLIPPIEGSDQLIELQYTPSGPARRRYEGPSHHDATRPLLIMDPPSPELDPQCLSGTPARIYGWDGLSPGYSHDNDSGCMHRAVSAAILEPSPMLQAMTQYAADPLPQIDYISEPQVDTYSQDANTLEASPIFAYAPPSPIPGTAPPTSSHTSTPAHKRRRVRELDSNDEDIVPAIRREPITPLQPARKHNTKSGPWLDPDEEPVWSTLPSRSKKSKQVKSPVATSRFRLPGAFLGSSSPLGEQEPKRLYKPPPRKRSLERDEDCGRWKVTRIG